MSYGILTPLFVLALAASTAAADPKQDAADLAAQSAKHYKRGEFEQAATLLRQAYDKFPEPTLLYNLARALEGLGDRPGAIDAYERYLLTAKKIEDRGGIERRVATLKAELEEQKKRAEQPKPLEPPKEEKPPPPPKVEKPLVLETSQPPPRKESSRSKLPWVVIGTGAAMLAAGGVMAYLADSADGDSRDAMSGAEAQKLHDKAKREALTANILFGVGGAVVITGVVLAW